MRLRTCYTRKARTYRPYMLQPSVSASFGALIRTCLSTLHDRHKFFCLAYSLKYTTRLNELSPQGVALPLSYRGWFLGLGAIVWVVAGVLLVIFLWKQITKR